MVSGLGIHDSGSRVASSFVLNEVASIHSKGARKTAVSAAMVSQNSTRRTMPQPVRRRTGAGR